MTTKTKNIFFASITSAVIALGSAGFFFYKIDQNSQKLDEQVKIVTENNAKETTFIRLRRLAQDTEDERAQLEGHFFANEGDSIAFLGEVETLASQLGLSLKTEALDKVVGKDKLDYVKVVFSYEGNKTTVLEFSRLMELLPYHSRVDSLKIDKSSSNNWRGFITVMITIDTI